MPKEVVDAVLRDFYVDDIMSGADSVEEAEKLMLNLIRLLQQSQLPIRKWASSEPTIISALPEELRENVSAFDVQDPEHEQHTLKTLGIRWHPAGDFFVFTVQHVAGEWELLGKVTKRELLGDILKLFDPNGVAISSDFETEDFHAVHVVPRTHVGRATSGGRQG